MKLGFFDNRERGGDNTPPPFDLNTSRGTQFPIPNRILVIGVVGLILLIVLSVLKGFYVDLINDFPGSPYKKIDNFVADSIEDGLKKLDYWLSVDSNKFNNFFQAP